MQQLNLLDLVGERPPQVVVKSTPKKKRKKVEKRTLQLDLFALTDLLDIEQPSLFTPQPTLEEPSKPVEPDPERETYAPSKTTRVLDNLASIRTLYRLEEAGTQATPSDKALLAKYTSFGAVSQVFDEEHADYQLVKEVLTPEDYAAARTATVNSFYTTLPIVRWMWDVLRTAGFEGGQILDPAMATGNFFSGMPALLRSSSNLVGVDMDLLAARIGRAIHDDAQVHISPYQKARLPENGFDVAITNVPFGDISIFNKSLGKQSIHNYFIMQMAMHTRPGGFVAVITSRHTMDAKTNIHREWLASQLDLLAAVRLPSKTFGQYAGTDVVTDVLFFHKPESGCVIDADPSWLHSEPIVLEGPRGEEEFYINKYFLERPAFVLGDFKATTGPFGAQLKVIQPEKNTVSLLENLDLGIEPVFVPSSTPTITVEIDDGERRPGEFFIRAGELRQKTAVGSEPVKAAGKKLDRITGQIYIALAARLVLQMNTEGTDAELATAQKHLRDTYDAFVSKLGFLNAQANRSVFKSDPNAPFVWALEIKTGEEEYEPSEIFFKRTIQQPVRPEFVEEATDALAISIADTGGVDWPLIERLTQKTQADLQSELSHVVYYNPAHEKRETDCWEPAHIYLSGNVRLKLKQAMECAGYPRFGLAKLQPNIDALNAVQPDWLDHTQIHAALGAPWIDAKYIEQFHFELLHPDSSVNSSDERHFDYKSELRWYCPYVNRITIRHSPHLNKWIVSTKRCHTVLATEKWGTHYKNAYELISAILNKSEIKVWEEDSDGNRYVNQTETIAAQQKAHEIKVAFQNWIFTDEERCKHLEEVYNHTFNATVPAEFDGSWLNFPGMSDQFTLRPHQANGVARILGGGNTLLWHIVGAGKSATMIASAMKAKQLGLRNKPLHVVPNHLLHQYAAEFYRFYPAANLLVIDPKAMAPNEKARAMAQIATGDWDSVIITHSSFNRIPLSPETHQQFHQRRIDAINAVIEELRHSFEETDKRTVKQLEKKRLRLKEKYERTLSKISHEKSGLYWESLGIDMLFVDECQEYKNLYYESTLAGYMPGISGTESGRAYDMYMKTQQMTRRCKSGHILGEFSTACHCGMPRDESTSLIFASGTPITNSVSEMYTMQRFLQLDELIQLGIHNFDSWATQFGDEVTTIEMKPSGKGWRSMTRFARFHNVPELLASFGMVSDAQMDPKALQLARPELVDGEPVGVTVEPSDALLEYVEECATRAENVKNVDPTEDNMLKIMGDALKAATDMRLVDPSAEMETGCKIDTVVQKVFEIWQNHPGKTQAVFLDISTPKSGKWSLYGDMKQRWVSMGIPEDEIAFAHDAKTDVQRKELFARVNTAEIRIIVGSTQKMGSGTNMQERLYALHNVDAPWTPALVEQREGRILRQGNSCPEVEIYRYVTERSLDFYKWHLLETKARFIAQIALRKGSDRSVEDIEASAISFAQMKAMATGDPLLIEQVALEADLNRLGSLVHSHQKSQREMKQAVRRMTGDLPTIQANISKLEQAIALRNGDDKEAPIVVNGEMFKENKETLDAIRELINQLPFNQQLTFTIRIGSASVDARYVKFGQSVKGTFQVGEYKRTIDLSSSASGTVKRFRNAIAGLDGVLNQLQKRLESTKSEIEQKKILLAKPNPQFDEYSRIQARLDEIHDHLAEQAIQEQRTNEDVSCEGDSEQQEPVHA